MSYSTSASLIFKFRPYCAKYRHSLRSVDTLVLDPDNSDAIPLDSMRTKTGKCMQSARSWIL